jgi:hypothetical protein
MLVEDEPCASPLKAPREDEKEVGWIAHVQDVNWADGFD